MITKNKVNPKIDVPYYHYYTIECNTPEALYDDLDFIQNEIGTAFVRATLTITPQSTIGTIITNRYKETDDLQSKLLQTKLF